MTVTIAGRQRKKVFQSEEEALELQETRENERVHGAAVRYSGDEVDAALELLSSRDTGARLPRNQGI